MKLAVVFFVSTLALAQRPATTSAPCSPIAPENTGVITIKCPGISKEQWQKMFAILNTILANTSKLDEIEKQINNLDPTAPVITYFYNGEQRISRPGQIIGGDPSVATHKTFEKMQAAQSANDWQSLNAICDDAIKESPKWLTPYLFKGLAIANLGKPSEAVPLLEDVRKKADGNMDYGPLVKQADELLQKLHAAGY